MAIAPRDIRSTCTRASNTVRATIRRLITEPNPCDDPCWITADGLPACWPRYTDALKDQTRRLVRIARRLEAATPQEPTP